MPRQTIGLKRCIKLLVMTFVFCFCTGYSFASDWRTVAKGIEYQDLGSNLMNPWSHIYVFRIDPKKNKLDIVLASELSREHASVDEFSQYSKALITLNGGFFDRQFHPLGLRVSNQKQYNPLKRISWWGVFYMKNGKPHIGTHRSYPRSNAVDFALQSGPRLIIDGNIPSLKPGVAERSAIGITKKGNVVILVTDNTPMTTTTLANLMKPPPLACIDALNLDGGSSSQLKANMKNLELSVHGFSRVSDAILVKPRI